MRAGTLILLALLAAALAAPAPVRHVDPATLPESGPDALALGGLYAQLTSSLAGFEFSSAKALLDSLSLAYVPGRYRDAYRRFNELLRAYWEAASSTAAYLGLAEALLGKREISRALEALSSASSSLVRARAAYEDVRLALQVLRAIGVPESLYARAQAGLDASVERLFERYRALEARLRSELSMPVPTVLSVNASPPEVLFGGDLRVVGRLSAANGSGLEGMRVVVHVGLASVEVPTGSDGRFELLVPVTTSAEVLRVYAEFPPYGGYNYSRSPDVYVRVVSVKPLLKAWLDNSTCLPGRSIVLHVAAGEGLTVVVTGPFGLNETFVSNGSTRSFTVRVPAGAKEGAYAVEVRSLPLAPVAPGFLRLSFNVVRATPRVAVEAPSFVLTGFAYALRVSANVSSTLEVRAPPGVEVRVSGSGIELRVPHSYLWTSLRLEVSVLPADPGYKPSLLTLEVPVYNTVVALAAAAGAALFILYNALPGVGGRPPAAVSEPAQPPASPPLEGLSALFRSLVLLLERLSGVRFEPSFTIREYMRAIEGVLPGALWERVRALLLRLEAALYSELERDRALAERVIGDLLSLLGGGS